MSSSNPLLWPRPPVVWGYGIAVVSVIAALTISRWPVLHLQDAPVSLFLCAVILSAWFGGAGPGLLAIVLSAFVFYYYFLSPIYSFAAKPGEIPRLLVFTASALFVGLLSAAQRSAMESLRRARDDLKKQFKRSREPTRRCKQRVVNASRRKRICARRRLISRMSAG
jgi:K+-sensing histidine kinase KdpD